MTQAATATPPKPRRSKARRWAIGIACGIPVAVLVLWVLVNRVEWLGPMVADGLRSVIGKDAVAELENIGYRIQDRIFRFTRRSEKPKAYWTVPTSTAQASATPPAPPPVAPTDTAPAKAVIAPFAPRDVGPVHKSWSAPGDGQWLPIAIPDQPALPPTLYKTLLHPDKNRSWAELFVVAMRVSDIELKLVAGSREPETTVEASKTAPRPGVIPAELHRLVLGAFNGGFKTEHGKYGMRIDDVVFVDARPEVCAVAAFKDGSLKIASWERLQPLERDMRWWRQTPHCMYEDNQLNAHLGDGGAKKWGATLDGETVIRRSAIGIDKTGETLFVGISNNTSAGAIALGMNHAGAATVAQLDVNFSYPKFVLYEAKIPGTERIAVALAEGFEFSADEFIRKASPRDFFYILPKAQP